jgi:hypothetical protein
MTLADDNLTEELRFGQALGAGAAAHISGRFYTLIRVGTIVGGFYSEVALQKREAEGTVREAEGTLNTS